jgi:hypothetical protein
VTTKFGVFLFLDEDIGNPFLKSKYVISYSRQQTAVLGVEIYKILGKNMGFFWGGGIIFLKYTQ